MRTSITKMKQTTDVIVIEAVDPEKGHITQIKHKRVEEGHQNPYIVDWYSPHDP